MAKAVKKTKKKTHVDANGVAHIKATFNNVIVTINGHLRQHNFLVFGRQERL